MTGGLGDHKMPSPRVARPQEPTEVTEVSDSFHRADAPAEDAPMATAFPETPVNFSEGEAPVQSAAISILDDVELSADGSREYVPLRRQRPLVRQPTWDLESFIAAGCPPATTPTNPPVFNESTRGRISPSTASSPIRKENPPLERSHVIQMLTGFTERGGSDVGRDGSPGMPRGLREGDKDHKVAGSPSSGLSYVTDDGPAARSPDPPNPPETPRDTTARTPQLAPNENHKYPLANKQPISRRPTVISITSSEHSRRQRGPLSRDSSIHAEEYEQSISTHKFSTSSTFTKTANQHVLHTVPSVSDGGACYPEAGRWTRGAFVIGRSAPVKIDEGIEVYLRSGANGEVNFII